MKKIIKQSGAITLITALALLLIATFFSLYAVSINNTDKAVISNLYQINQADINSQTGMNVAIAALQKTGHSKLPKTMRTANYSSYYQLSHQNGKRLVTVLAKGISPNQRYSRQISQELVFQPLLRHVNTATVTILKGPTQLSQKAKIINPYYATTIQSGGKVTLTDNAATLNHFEIGSFANNIKADIKQRLPQLAKTSTLHYFTNFFVNTLPNFSKYACIKLFANISKSFNQTLNQQKNCIFYISQKTGSAHISSNTVIGTRSHPVIVVIHGNLQLQQQSKLYGFVYVTGDMTLTQHAQIIGEAIVGKKLILRNHAKIVMDKPLLTRLQKNIGRYAVVPGSWHDFD